MFARKREENPRNMEHVWFPRKKTMEKPRLLRPFGISTACFWQFQVDFRPDLSGNFSATVKILPPQAELGVNEVGLLKPGFASLFFFFLAVLFWAYFRDLFFLILFCNSNPSRLAESRQVGKPTFW